MEALIEEFGQLVAAIQFGARIAVWMPWAQLVAVAILAAGVGWALRGMRDARRKREAPSISLNPTTGFYEYTLGGQLYEFVFAPTRAGAQRTRSHAERAEPSGGANLPKSAEAEGTKA